MTPENTMEVQTFVWLAVRVNPGPMERFEVQFSLENTVERLKMEVEKRCYISAAALEMIHHGKILQDKATLNECGVKSGAFVHVIRKKATKCSHPIPVIDDSELEEINAFLRNLGSTPNTPGWTRAMKLLNQESVMNEILEAAPALGEDCVALSILHEVELLLALAENLTTMRRGALAQPELTRALKQLIIIMRTRPEDEFLHDDSPISGYEYSLEALAEEADTDEEEDEDDDSSDAPQEKMAAALQETTEAVVWTSSGDSAVASTSRGVVAYLEMEESDRSNSLLQLLWAADALAAAEAAAETTAETAADGEEAMAVAGPSGCNALGMYSGATNETATTEAMSSSSSRGSSVADIAESDCSNGLLQLLRAANAVAAAEESSRSTEYYAVASTSSASTSQGIAVIPWYIPQLYHMNEMGFLDDARNIRALSICSGDVTAAINLVFSGAINED